MLDDNYSFNAKYVLLCLDAPVRGRPHIRIRVLIGVRFGVRFGAKGGLQ
jgi:hypothetical protein